jgi:2-keto-4-pentenoate hydratase
MTPEAAQEAADLIWTHWHEGRRLVALSPALRPGTRAEGHAVQAGLERCSRGPLFGWKIAATSAAGQAHIGVEGPLAGRLLAESVFAEGATLPFGANAMRVAEPEFAFRMAHPLPPRPTPYSQEEVLAAVAALHLAIEVPDSRFEDFANAGGPQLIADNACAHQFVLEPEVRGDWRGIDLAEHRLSIAAMGRPAHAGQGANCLGDPRLALTWLVNELSRHGITLGGGHVVTTGTCAVPLPILPGDRITAEFGDLGRVGLSFKG